MFTSYLFFLKMGFILTALLILLSNMDDSFIDFYYIIHKIRRKFFIYRKFRPFQANDLAAKPEQYFVLMIPAWQEANVIQAMVKNTLASYDYRNYHIFIGCYPNDRDTIKMVEPLLLHHENIHLSLLDHAGPTSKADCLNRIYEDICDFERQAAFNFTGYILHDAEDIVHSQELRLYNHLLPRKDMVQIPVIPLRRPWYDLTGGHYIDEFAENHIKELVVRESLTGHVPSAGVGTALSRRAMAVITKNHSRLPFDTANLTEDYDLALRLKKNNLKMVFARFNVQHRARGNDVIATREFFPNKLTAAVRQKSRWLMGIALQGWRHQGWHGSLAMRYVLFRDRKGILTAQLSVAAYFIILNIFIIWLMEWLMPDGYRYPPLVRRGEPLEYLLWANLFFLISRALHRIYFTCQIYGIRTGLMSLPRQLWGNVVNFLAALRALRLYSGHLLLGRSLAWDKTTHVFPEPKQLIPDLRHPDDHENNLTGAEDAHQN